uniref:Uncharacterized protein n=1 Tax=Anguilla anguilla TaxID=7936 RepID=A0A0E9PAV0_ANGAN
MSDLISQQLTPGKLRAHMSRPLLTSPSF